MSPAPDSPLVPVVIDGYIYGTYHQACMAIAEAIRSLGFTVPGAASMKASDADTIRSMIAAIARHKAAVRSHSTHKALEAIRDAHDALATLE